ncbi:MAG: D-alanine--D-alanine ligase [Cyanobacteria bacterium NC_groundwater_1444_Ag_S-0.65um_54_12]|nr:D-alanine--D-alanine ligase [Cyanobacteria bacterium NC_groundwater_1444_Ag_S-0.65um_54_12]
MNVKDNSQKRLRVAVLCGGISSEREISLESGRAVLEQLDSQCYETKLYDLADFISNGKDLSATLLADSDVVFLALHGPGGEDGTLQGLLELYGLPYTGSGVLASALAMDKAMTKLIYRQAGLPVAPDLSFSFQEVAECPVQEIAGQVADALGFPVIVKSNNQGSTRGVLLASNLATFESAWAEAKRYHSGIIVEAFVKGREFTVPVIGGKQPAALPVVEIIPKKASFFTYEAKYEPGGSEEIVPAALETELTGRLQELGLAAHRALGCWGVSRTDILLSWEGQPVLLETNTIPGMTENSLLPKSLRAAGWSLSRFADCLINWAFERSALLQLERQPGPKLLVKHSPS